MTAPCDGCCRVHRGPRCRPAERRSVTVSTEHLYGTPGAETMEFDPESVLEHETNDLVTIEEWTVKPARAHLPEADVLLDWLTESDYEVTEGWWESATDACDDELKAAAEALLDLMASKITFRMADRHIANLAYRWDGDEDTGEYVLVSREITPDGANIGSSVPGRGAGS